MNRTFNLGRSCSARCESSRPFIPGSVGQCAQNPLIAGSYRLRGPLGSFEVAQMIIGRLLKSCAMPPLSCPTASSRCESELLLKFAQALLRLSPFGDVSRDLGEANNLPVVIANRVDED